jgi:tRNA threonylcarbamoyladenosine biosynthesis protein TsaE
MEAIKFSLRNIQTLCDLVIKTINKENLKYPVLLLDGDMGSGKTTFTYHFVKTLDPNGQANSPTYTLVNEYHLKDVQVYHFDLFRINHESELEDLGFEEIWNVKGISIIEWWTKAKSYITFPALLINFTVIDPFHRMAKVGLYQP